MSYKPSQRIINKYGKEFKDLAVESLLNYVLYNNISWVLQKENNLKDTDRFMLEDSLEHIQDLLFYLNHKVVSLVERHKKAISLYFDFDFEVPYGN